MHTYGLGWTLFCIAYSPSSEALDCLTSVNRRRINLSTYSGRKDEYPEQSTYKARHSFWLLVGRPVNMNMNIVVVVERSMWLESWKY